MIRKILIANRGEIAVRIVRACRDLHVQSAAIYTAPDVSCLHVKIADEAYKVSDDPLKGYLDAKTIVQTALECGADATRDAGIDAVVSSFAGRIPEIAEKRGVCRSFTESAAATDRTARRR